MNLYTALGIAFTALGSLGTGVGLFFFWSGQQRIMQQSSAKPVLDIYVDRDKTLRIKNLGTMDVEDVVVYATIYEMRGKVNEPIEIASFSKVSGPVFQQPRVLAQTGEAIFKLSEPWLPVGDVPKDPEVPLPALYVLRVLVRNSVNKERIVRYVIATPNKLPNPFDDLRDVSMTGPWQKLDGFTTIRKQIREHQAALFDDQNLAFQ